MATATSLSWRGGQNADSAPSTNITTTQANSAVVCYVADFEAGTTSVTWRANAGAFTPHTAFDDTAYSVYGGYHADAGAVGTYALGWSTPTGPDWSLVAVEIKGSAGGGPPTVKKLAALGVG